jgi:hypothetical protein
MEEDRACVHELVKHMFSPDEKKEIASEMAQKIIDLQRADEERKTVSSRFKSRIDRLQAEINRAAEKLNSGYEMQEVECDVIPDYDNKVFCYYRTDTDQMVKQKPMTADDLQRKIA